MKKLAMLVIAILAVAFVAPNAFAEKIAFVDIGKVFDGYSKTKDNDAALTSEGQKKQTERDAMVAEIRKLKDEQALLSEKAKEEKQVIVDAKIRQLQEFDNAVRRDLGGRRDTVVKEIFKDIEDVVKNYGKQKGYDYILNQRLVLYSNAQLDVTEPILVELNASYASKAGKKK